MNGRRRALRRRVTVTLHSGWQLGSSRESSYRRCGCRRTQTHRPGRSCPRVTSARPLGGLSARGARGGSRPSGARPATRLPVWTGRAYRCYRHRSPGPTPQRKSARRRCARLLSSPPLARPARACRQLWRRGGPTTPIDPASRALPFQSAMPRRRCRASALGFGAAHPVHWLPVSAGSRCAQAGIDLVEKASAPLAGRAAIAAASFATLKV